VGNVIGFCLEHGRPYRYWGVYGRTSTVYGLLLLCAEGLSDIMIFCVSKKI
jgi:hypothetical protein